MILIDVSLATPKKWKWWAVPTVGLARSQFRMNFTSGFLSSRWQLNDELGSTPSTSSFRRALDVSHGTLSILDNSATVYTRIWCDYEAMGPWVPWVSGWVMII